MTTTFRADANSASVTVQWHGDDLKAALDSHKANALFEAAKVIVDAARAKAPRRRGHLRKSGYAKAAGGKSTYRGGPGRRRPPKLRKGQAVAAFSRFYAGFQERGTRRHRAQPFVGPTTSSHRNQATQAAVRYLKREVGL